jgi:hypothetical protein
MRASLIQGAPVCASPSPRKNPLKANKKYGILIKVKGGSTGATSFTGQHPYLPNPSADHKAILFTPASPGQTGDDFISLEWCRSTSTAPGRYRRGPKPDERFDTYRSAFTYPRGP